jgi:hypothetical protein
VRLFVLSIVVAFQLMLGATSAQTIPNSSPSDPQLTISTRDNQLSFRIGEIIPLDLAFTSSSPNKYQMDMASYDRSGRLNEDKFVADPSTGWDDPLQLYFRSYKGFKAGGLRGFKSLTPVPTTVHVELNEWIRFKTPGQYRITVTSGRVSEIGSSTFGGLSVASNTLIITIVPATKEWQDATLKSAIQFLDSTKPPVVPPANPADPRSQAVKTLRYLGTPEAAREMVRRMTGTVSDWDFAAGLMGSPARSVALEEMKKLLVDPNFPVSGRFLNTMSVLALPDGIVDNIPEEREKAETQFRQELMSALAQKQGAALAVSNNTIISTAAASSSSLPPDLKRTLTRQLVATFDSLSSQEQYVLLEFRWSTLDHEQMLPLLKRVEQKESDDMQSKLASAAALKRWYEMAPDEARPVVIQEILRPKPRFSARTLGILPDKELPEADQPLVEHLAPSSDFWASSNSASLIHRYATRAAEPKVIAFLDPVVGRLACAIQAPLLAYVLKDDPEAARPLLERAMEARGKEKGFTACNHSLLTDVGALQSNNVLQDIAIKSLGDSDPEVVGDAASYLKQFGSASAESVLWTRMVAWSERWKGHEKDLQSVPGENMSAMYESAAGSHLVEALGAGHGWLPDEAKLHRLIDLSVTAAQKQQAEQFLKTWQARPWPIMFVPVVGQLHIAQFQEVSIESAKEKLLQFPPGSAFEWVQFGQEGEQKAFEKMSQFANEHGLKLVSKQQQKPD